MNDGIRLERNRFRPDQGLAAEVVRLEERVVLNSSFKLPPALVGLLPGQSGNLIMTSRAYGAAQSMVIKAFDNFAGTIAKIQKQYGANYLSDPAAIAKIGLGGAGTYGANTALGRLDTALRTAGAKFPYGRGVATDPVNAAQLGTGLSIRSAAFRPILATALINHANTPMAPLGFACMSGSRPSARPLACRRFCSPQTACSYGRSRTNSLRVPAHCFCKKTSAFLPMEFLFEFPAICSAPHSDQIRGNFAIVFFDCRQNLLSRIIDWQFKRAEHPCDFVPSE